MQPRILLDECVPKRVQDDLKKYYEEVRRAQELNLQGIKEGEFLRQEKVRNRFDVFITTERKEDTLKHDIGDTRQYEMGIIVIDPRDPGTGDKLHPTVENIRPLYGAVVKVANEIKPGEMVRIQTNRQIYTMDLKHEADLRQEREAIRKQEQVVRGEVTRREATEKKVQQKEKVQVKNEEEKNRIAWARYYSEALINAQSVNEEDEIRWRRGLSPSERADLNAMEKDAGREITSAEYYARKREEQLYDYTYRYEYER